MVDVAFDALQGGRIVFAEHGGVEADFHDWDSFGEGELVAGECTEWGRVHQAERAVALDSRLRGNDGMVRRGGFDKLSPHCAD